MPPWWVYKNHGERSDLRPARFLCVSPCKRFDCVGVVSDVFNHTTPLTTFLDTRFIRCLLSYSETGKSLTLSRLSYVPTVCLFILPESGA